MPPIVIIGSGLAGYTVLREFRKRDQATPVTLICADDGHFYSKPNLSNALAAGKTAEQLVNTPREKMAADLKAEIVANTRVTAIDVAGRKVPPETIEQELRRHPAVADCLVFGVPARAAERGERIVAAVACRSAVNPDTLRQSCWSTSRRGRCRANGGVEALAANPRGKLSPPDCLS